MSKDAPKKNKKRPSLKQLKTIKLMSANVRMSTSEAMRQAGYSKSSARKPQRITKSETFKDVLNRIGFTDERLARGYEELAGASTMREITFLAKKVNELIKIDESSPDWDEEGPMNQIKEDSHYVHLTRKEIDKALSKIPGAQFAHSIEQYDRTVVYYSVPEYGPRAKALELASKAKGSFSPEQVNVTIEDEEITPEERKQLEALRDLNA